MRVVVLVLLGVEAVAAATMQQQQQQQYPLGAAAPPAGALLWSNVSEGGLGERFATAVPLAPAVSLAPPIAAASTGGDSQDVLLVGPGGQAIQRLHPASGALAWSLPLSQAGLPGTVSSLCVTTAYTGGAAEAAPSPPLLVVWGSDTESTSVVVVDVVTGKLLWKFGLPFDEMSRCSCAAGVFLGLGRAYYNTRGQASPPGPYNTGTSRQVQVMAYAINVAEAPRLLLNTSIGGPPGAHCSGCRSRGSCLARAGCSWDDIMQSCSAGGDWYAGTASLVTNPADGTQVALVGTVDGSDSAVGSLWALSTADGSRIFAAHNITATQLRTVADVVVVSADTRPLYGQETKLLMLRGYSLTNGSMLWQRSVDGRAEDGIRGVELSRACDHDWCATRPQGCPPPTPPFICPPFLVCSWLHPPSNNARVYGASWMPLRGERPVSLGRPAPSRVIWWPPVRLGRWMRRAGARCTT
jgi:hypothetical protein